MWCGVSCFGVEGLGLWGSALRQNNDGDGLHSPAVAVGVASGVPAVGVGRGGGGRTRCLCMEHLARGLQWVLVVKTMSDRHQVDDRCDS